VSSKILRSASESLRRGFSARIGEIARARLHLGDALYTYRWSNRARCRLIGLRIRLYVLADGNLKRFVHEYIYVAAYESRFAWKGSET
jgi:hypothetical protein